MHQNLLILRRNCLGFVEAFLLPPWYLVTDGHGHPAGEERGSAFAPGSTLGSSDHGRSTGLLLLFLSKITGALRQ